jgi:hypothetical protein
LDGFWLLLVVVVEHASCFGVWGFGLDSFVWVEVARGGVGVGGWGGGDAGVGCSNGVFLLFGALVVFPEQALRQEDGRCSGDGMLEFLQFFLLVLGAYFGR